MTQENGRDGRYFELSRVFRPHAPVDEARLFAGRTHQLAGIVDAINQVGRHVVLFGERGVGKTSLARVFHDFLETPHNRPETDLGAFVPFITCDSSDDYSSLWHKLFQQIELVENRPRMGFTSAVDRSITDLSSRLKVDCGPDDVVRLLRFLAETATLAVFVIDEFDRLREQGASGLFADTIKILSDYAVPVTLLLVGVADNVNDLIDEHASIERACVQISMPRMSPAELGEIVHRGLESVEMAIAQEAVDYIVSLSQGLPHYTHLLGLAAARAALTQNRETVTRQDVSDATKSAVEGVQESILSAYHNSTMSAKKTLYPQVLLACALADADERGFFAAGDVRSPMSTIMGRPYDIPAFSKHLHDLSQTERGPVLQRIGIPKRYRFRFINPLMQPFVIMHGLQRGLIVDDQIFQIRGS